MLRHIRHSTLITLIGLVGVAATGIGGMGASAAAAPIDDKQAEAAAIQDRIDANGQRVSALGEELNGAQLRLEESERAIAAAQEPIDAARAEVARITRLVELRAGSVYRRAVQGQSLDGFSFDDAGNLLTRRHYASKQAERDDGLLQDLARAQQELAEERATAERARADALAEQTQIESARAELEAANAEQAAILERVEGELEALVAEEARRRAEAEAAAARARYSLADGNQLFPNLPAPGPAAATAIEFARTQLGKPYRYAAAGPNAYDCSGLTMAAYAAAGISLPHYSGAQYSLLPHVPLRAMQPGDLVFWGPGASNHVGLYVGGGQIIDASSSKNAVTERAIWGSPMGAARVV